MKFVQHLIKAFKDWRYLPTQFLISKLKKSESAEIRSYAAEALGAIGDANANQPLIDALQDTNNSVRRFAISSLGHLRNTTAITPLIPFLQDEEPDIRCATAIALGKINHSSAVEALIPAATEDADRSVCSAAIIALGKIGDKRAIEPLNNLMKQSDNEWILRYVSETLHQIEENKKNLP